MNIFLGGASRLPLCRLVYPPYARFKKISIGNNRRFSRFTNELRQRDEYEKYIIKSVLYAHFLPFYYSWNVALQGCCFHPSQKQIRKKIFKKF